MSIQKPHLVWTNPEPPIPNLETMFRIAIVAWAEFMTAALNYVDTVNGYWTGQHMISSGRWTKKICVQGDRTRTLYVVLDYDGFEIASIPISFSVALMPHSVPSRENLTKTERHR